ncbi:MAG: RagB/SusD family nutrient uptake outer membrane protein [Tannerella sp.]|jgi:hypothetical protein|nr:RagB/SusD family nutrient uptake outer membrane protein [Tannerella sp.]
MKIKNYIIGLIVFGGLSVSCNDLDIPPMNVIQDKDLFGSIDGAMIYLSRMYSQMPYHDFKYSPNRQFFDDWLVTPGANSGQSLARDGGEAMTSEGGSRNGAYWTRAFELLRDANHLLEVAPDYKSNFTEMLYNHLLGEAYYTRAIVYYALAQRYGGMPIVTEVLKYPENSADALEVPRSSEEETWNQVLADFDKAIELLMPVSPKVGLSNKYVALAFKSEAMLYAGTVAKYNRITGLGQKTGVRVIGFDPGRETELAKKYLLESYNAARTVMKSNIYSLYKKKWAANDKAAQYQNMVDMFSDESSSETILLRQYVWPNNPHGYDSYNIPRQLMGGNGYSAGNCPTLDFVELFDGFDKNPDGTIKVFDDKGKYLMFDNVTDLFKDAEPRLKAYVILPGEVFKGEAIEIRRGIFTGDASNGIDPLLTINGKTDYETAPSQRYTNVDAYVGRGAFSGKQLYLSPNGTLHEIVPLKNGTQMNAGGKSGPFTSDMTAAITGFTIRKWLNEGMAQSLVLEGRSEQPFVLMRYAEILLNAAEAGAELKLLGASAPAGDDFMQIAYEAIRDIRERAGADPLKSAADVEGDAGLQIIRKERYKELAFEWKSLWDIRRWRIQHSVNINGRTQSDGAYYKGLYPFYASDVDKWFFDARIQEDNKRFRLTENEYYFAIPSGEVSKSNVIDQQPGR